MAVLNKQIYQSAEIRSTSKFRNPIKSGKKVSNNGGMLVFPDGNRMSYQNITEKNIYIIINKYSDFLHPDTLGVNSQIRYKLGRLALTFNDGDAIIAVGKISSMGFEYLYKMYYVDDDNLSAIYYYPARNYEEVTINSGKCVFKSFNALRQLVKVEEINGEQSNIYEINPETNDIRCISV